jgi:hypothetical protein
MEMAEAGSVKPIISFYFSAFIGVINNKPNIPARNKRNRGQKPPGYGLCEDNAANILKSSIKWFEKRTGGAQNGNFARVKTI